MFQSKSFWIALIVAVCALRAMAQDQALPVPAATPQPTPAPAQSSTAGLTATRIYQPPPGTKPPPAFVNSGPGAKPAGDPSTPGYFIEPRDLNPDERDVKGYFEKQGIKFPREGYAIYNTKSATLIVLGAYDDKEIIDRLAGNAGFRRLQLHVEYSVLECALAPGSSVLALHPLAWPDIERLPAKSVKVLDRVTSTFTPGDRAIVNHIANPNTGRDTGDRELRAFAPGESGIMVENEAEMEDNALACDVNVDFHFRKQLDAQDPKSVDDINFFTAFSSWNGSPVVLDISAEPGHEGNFIVVTACVRLFRGDGLPADIGGKTGGDAVD